LLPAEKFRSRQRLWRAVHFFVNAINHLRVKFKLASTMAPRAAAASAASENNPHSVIDLPNGFHSGCLYLIMECMECDLFGKLEEMVSTAKTSTISIVLWPSKWFHCYK
jgi:hypothetical protein